MKHWSPRLWWQVLSAGGNCHFAVSQVHVAPTEALLNATAKISAGKKPKKVLPSTGTFNLLVVVRPAFCYAESSWEPVGKVQIYVRIRFFFFSSWGSQQNETVPSSRILSHASFFFFIFHHIAGTDVCLLWNSGDVPWPELHKVPLKVISCWKFREENTH